MRRHLNLYLHFLARSAAALGMGLALAMLGGMLAANIGGNMPNPENIRFGNLAGYEATGLIGFWLTYSLWIAFVSDWVLMGQRQLKFHVSAFIIALLEVAALYKLINPLLNKIMHPSIIFVLVVFSCTFFLIPIASIWGYRQIKKLKLRL